MTPCPRVNISARRRVFSPMRVCNSPRPCLSVRCCCRYSLPRSSRFGWCIFLCFTCISSHFLHASQMLYLPTFTNPLANRICIDSCTQALTVQYFTSSVSRLTSWYLQQRSNCSITQSRERIMTLGSGWTEASLYLRYLATHEHFMSDLFSHTFVSMRCQRKERRTT